MLISVNTVLRVYSIVRNPAEYADLSAELDRIGYNLRVVRKDCMGDSKYTDSRREQLQM